MPSKWTDLLLSTIRCPVESWRPKIRSQQNSALQQLQLPDSFTRFLQGVGVPFVTSGLLRLLYHSQLERCWLVGRASRCYRCGKRFRVPRWKKIQACSVRTWKPLSQHLQRYERLIPDFLQRPGSYSRLSWQCQPSCVERDRSKFPLVELFKQSQPRDNRYLCFITLWADKF